MKKIFITITKILLIAVPVIYLIWDIIVASTDHWSATLSKILKKSAIAFPFIAAAWGVLTSHFFLSKEGIALFGFLGKTRFYIWIPLASLFLISMIVAWFKKSVYLHYMGDHLIIPLAFGIILGLMWYQK